MEEFGHLIRIAKKDLAAATDFYSNRLYFFSVCALQQSVEMANMAFANKHNVISVTEKDINLRKPIPSFKAFIKEILISDFMTAKEGYEMMAELLFINKLNLPENQALRNIFSPKELTFPRDRFVFWLNLPESDIDELILLIKEMGEITIPDFNNVKTEFLAKAKSIVEVINLQYCRNEESLRMEIETTLNSENRLIELAEAIYNFTYSPGFRQLGKSIFGLIYLSLILHPHAPSNQQFYSDCNLSQDIFYTKSLPLVRKMPDLLAIQKDNIQYLEMDRINFKFRAN